jgi:aminopeptidase
MSDLWKELARILVSYSIKVQPSDNVLVTMMEVDTFPLLKAVYAQVVAAGGYPFVEFQSALLERELMLHGSQEQLDWVTDPSAYAMKWADAYVGLRGNRNPYEFQGISAKRLKSHKKAMGQLSAMRTELSRWVLVRVPNESLAQQAEMSLDEMMAFFFNATLRDWEQEVKRYREIRDVFQKAAQVRILGKGTDLRFSTAGRTYLIGDGSYNMPDGEIYTCPVDDSAAGHIYFDFPGVYAGQRIHGIRLEFEDGQLASARAESNEDLLQELVQMDEGANRIGEFGVGTNFGIDRFVYDILYDEKIGGTVHIALGRAYAEAGGVNYSALHWDLIKDLRQEGEIWLDEEKVFEKGNFLF